MLFDYRGYGEAKFVGMDNFVRVFTRDPVFWDSVVNTFVYVGGKLILTLPIAFMLAFLLSKSTRINAVSQSIIFTPTIMSSCSDGSYLLSAVQYIQRRDQPFSDVAWRHR